MFGLAEEVLLLGLCFKDDDGVIRLNYIIVNFVDGLLNNLQLMAFGVLKFLNVVLEVGFLVVLGLEIVLQRVFVFLVGLLHFLDVGNEDNLMDIKGLVFLVPCFVVNEVLQLPPHSNPGGNILYDGRVVRKIRFHLIVVSPGLDNLVLNVEQSQDVDDEGADPEHIFENIGNFVCAGNHHEQVGAFAGEVEIVCFSVGMGSPGGERMMWGRVRGGYCVRAAVISPLLDGEHQRHEVVADDQQNQQDNAVPYEHVEKGEAEAQEFQGLSVLTEGNLPFVDLLVAAVADVLRCLIIEADSSSLRVPFRLLPVHLILTLVKHHFNDIYINKKKQDFRNPTQQTKDHPPLPHSPNLLMMELFIGEKGQKNGKKNESFSNSNYPN